MAIKLSDLMNPAELVALYNQRTTLMLLGAPGCGKSYNIRRMPEVLSEALGVPFAKLHPTAKTEQMIPSIDAPDARGFVIPTKSESGQPIARYTYPPILPSKEFFEANPYGIIFLDEFYQGEHLTAKALAPLILERILGETQLPDGWWVVGASNRTEDRSGVNKPLMHIVNRMRTVEIQTDINDWATWAEAQGVHPMGITFARRQPGVVITDKVPSEPKPFCTPRSFTSAMGYIQQKVGNDMSIPDDHVTQQMVGGDIGDGASAQFFGFIKVADHIPTIEQILTDPVKAKCPGHDHLDAAFAARQLCLHYASGDNIEVVWEYCERLPKELQVSTAKALLDRKDSGALLNSKRLGKWVAENRALIVSSID